MYGAAQRQDESERGPQRDKWTLHRPACRGATVYTPPRSNSTKGPARSARTLLLVAAPPQHRGWYVSSGWYPRGARLLLDGWIRKLKDVGPVHFPL